MRHLTKIESKINSKIGKAIHDYGLIDNGDRILVAVSGGKDSLTLMAFLKKIQAWAPVRFDLVAAHITTDFECGCGAGEEHLSGHFEKLAVEYVTGHVDVLDEKGHTSCFWCSWNKRKALFALAEEKFCNKIALGHHKDDIVETVLLNLLFKGEISAINPRQELFGGKLTLIRPLCYVDEKLIKIYAKDSGLMSRPCKCPFSNKSKRKIIKDLIKEIEKKAPGTGIKTNIFSSISRIRRNYIDIGAGRSRSGNSGGRSADRQGHIFSQQ
jgi:tRNA 2-thiocytidine biosynthesis protein TtcA